MAIKSKSLDFFKNKLNSKIEQHSNLKKILINMGWLSFDRFFQIGVSLLVIIWVVRYLGPEQFGTLSYAGVFSSIFGVFATLGLGSILVRDIVSNMEKKDVLLGTGFALMFCAAIISFLISIFAALFFIQNDFFLVILITITAFPVIINSLSIIDYFFSAKVQSKYGVIGRNLSITITSCLKLLMVFFGFPLIYFALVGILETLICASTLIYFYYKTGNNISTWKFDFSLAKKLLADGWPLILVAFFGVIITRLSQIIIGNTISMSDLGYFAVVVKMTEFVNFIPGVLVVSLFPALILSKKTNHNLYKDRFLKLYDLLIALGVLFSLGLFLFAEPFIVLLYGEGYREASKILILYSWTIIPFFINIALSNYFIIEHKTNIYLAFSIIVGISSIFLNFWLITWAGLFGAALATFIVYWLNFVLLFILKDTREHAFIILKALFIPKTFFRLLSYIGIK